MLNYCFICLHWLASVQAAQVADLAFGHAQVEQFMRDRPEVKSVLAKEVVLRDHLVKGFAGVETGFRVHWDNQEPEVRGANYRPRYGEEPARVRVSKARYATGADVCVTLVMELEHSKNENRLNAIQRMAYFDQMSRDDYARSMTHTEFQSAHRAREFFRQHPLPPSEAGSSYKWLMGFPSEFSDYLESLCDSNDPEESLVEYHRQAYDKLISQRKYDPLQMIPPR